MKNLTIYLDIDNRVFIIGTKLITVSDYDTPGCPDRQVELAQIVCEVINDTNLKRQKSNSEQTRKLFLAEQMITMMTQGPTNFQSI